MSTNEPAEPSGKPAWEKAKLVAGAVSALVILIVVLQNTEAVETRILFLTLTMPRAALLLGTLLIGYGLGFLSARWIRRNSKRSDEHKTEASKG